IIGVPGTILGSDAEAERVVGRDGVGWNRKQVEVCGRRCRLKSGHGVGRRHARSGQQHIILQPLHGRPTPEQTIRTSPGRFPGRFGAYVVLGTGCGHLTSLQGGLGVSVRGAKLLPKVRARSRSKRWEGNLPYSLIATTQLALLSLYQAVLNSRHDKII